MIWLPLQPYHNPFLFLRSNSENFRLPFAPTLPASGDEDYTPVPMTNKNGSDLIRPSLLLMETLSDIHGPANANDPNSQGHDDRLPESLVVKKY